MKNQHASPLRQIVVTHLREERLGLTLAGVYMLGLTAMELLLMGVAGSTPSARI